MKQVKTISKTGWIPKGEKIGETWSILDIDPYNAAYPRKGLVTEHVGVPRKVKVTLTLTVEDVK